MAAITKIYQAWKDMQRRCSDTKAHNYHRYGGRGIKVCEQWVNSYSSFERWSLNNGFAEKMSIDRIDANKGYGPSNCRWTTIKVQANNTSTNRFVTYNGETLTYEQWGDRLGACKGFVWNRINNMGWSPEEAVSIPKSKHWNRHIKNNVLPCQQ